MSTFRPANLFDRIFEGDILIKGASGVLELLGGVLLIFISPAGMHNFLVAITQRELIEDPRDRIANLLLQTTQQFTTGTKLFLILYLWLHAIVKLIAVIGILKNQLWAYPFSLITLGLLMLYQIYSIFFVHRSIGMILLTLFDIIILWMIWREYGRFKTRHANIEAA
jgi:uncharacterized membrane protein